MKATIRSITLILVVLIFPDISKACKCGRSTQGPEVALKNALVNADLVVLGTVQSVIPTVLPEVGDQINLNDLRYLPGSSGNIVGVLIEKLWKGDVSSSEIQFFIGNTGCDLRLELGKNEILFAYGPDYYGYYTSNRCTNMVSSYQDQDQMVETLGAIDPAEIKEWESDYITYGCGGGVTASYSSNTLYRDGQFSGRKFSHLGDSKDETFGLDPSVKLAQSVFNSLDLDDLDLIDGVREPAPYMCELRAKIFGRLYRAEWGGGDSKPSESLMKQLRRIWRR